MRDFNPLAYFAAARLIEKSPYHYYMDDEDIKRCILPPLDEGLFILGVLDEDYNQPFLFATYAFPEPEHIEEYLETKTFPREGFYGQGNIPWVIDFICLTGKRDIIGGFRYLKAMFKELGYDKARWLRTIDDRQGWHELKGD
jgi:hemolysin-activating ACP:hemolysin acyltransferase|tara:strand:- start:138 stop:563 length:426 start_codon:yes stop_codon:yes gene_type:complete